MGLVNNYFLLVFNDYANLMKLKEETQKEYDATGQVVLTANMNIQVLMADVLNKKKRVIARIDATETGQSFLSDLVENGDLNQVETVLRRMKTGTTLNMVRKKTNRELVDFQNYSKELCNEVKEFKVSVIRFVRTKAAYYENLAKSSLTEGEDSVDWLVYSTLAEELAWLIDEIKMSKAIIF